MWVTFIFVDIHRDLCVRASVLVRIEGGGAAPSLSCYPLCFLFFHKHHRLFGLIFFFIAVHIDLCLCTSFMFFLGTHCRGPPHLLLFFHWLPLLPTLLPFVHNHRFLRFIFSFFFFQNIHRDLCLCASFLIFSFLLAIYPLRLVPMCFSLGTHCGGRR